MAAEPLSFVASSAGIEDDASPHVSLLGRTERSVEFRVHHLGAPASCRQVVVRKCSPARCRRSQSNEGSLNQSLVASAAPPPQPLLPLGTVTITVELELFPEASVDRTVMV